MAFQVSPGVQVRERDLTNVVPAVATSIGGIVMAAQRGPVDEITPISSEEELVSIFGKPQTDGNQFEDWMSAASFLGYGNALRVVRPSTATLKNATAGSAGLLIKNTTHYTDGDGTTGPYIGADASSSSVGNWVAKTAGAWGNSLKVSICATAAIFEEEFTSGAGTVNANTNAGLTAVVVANGGSSGDGGAKFNVGDIVHFSESNGQEYKITGKSGDTLNIERFGSANTAGGLTNNIAAGATVRRRWEHYDKFDSAPGTSTWVSDRGGANDEMHVIVIDEDGVISGVVGEVLETWTGVSKASDALAEDGSDNYYVNVFYTGSDYVYVTDHAATNWGTTGVGTTFTNVTAPINDSLTNGTDDFTLDAGEVQLGIDRFSDSETVDLNLFICGKADATEAKYAVDMCTDRKDCVAFVSPERADVVNVTTEVQQTKNVKDFFSSFPSSSYAVFDSGYKYTYDKYNDTYRFIPLNGDIAGLCARTDSVADSWFSPAGFSRGQIRGVVKLAYNPQKANRDILYKNRVNPVCTFPGQGTVLFGDKTSQSKPSAFDRINVRRLFITLEKAISTAAKFQLFEFNDEFTRADFRNQVEPFLRDVQGRRGITDFLVVCDETNNTGSVIDRNEFISDIYIKPARSINFISLNFVATKTGVSFSEVVGA